MAAVTATENGQVKVPATKAALRLRLSYAVIRRLISVGQLPGGWDAEHGYFVFASALPRDGE